MSARRIVTGVDARGRAVVASDGPAEELVIEAGRTLRVDDVWGADERSSVPTDGSKPAYERFYPPASGFRVTVVHIEPDSGPPLDYEKYLVERERVFVGYSEDAVVDENDPELHATQTVDVAVVLEGEITMGLDGGAEVTVRKGDYVVQNGTLHSWRNRSAAPCVIVFFLLGADQAPASASG